MRSRNNGGDQHGEQWQINVLNVQKDVEKHGFPFGTWSSDLLFHGGKKPHRTWSKYVKILLPTVTPLVEDVSWDLHKLRNATSALRQNHGAVAAVLHREDHPVPEWSHQVASGTNGYD